MLRRLFVIVLLIAIPISAFSDEPIAIRQNKIRSTEISINPIGTFILARLGGAAQFKVSDQVALTVPFSVGLPIGGSLGAKLNHISWSIYSGVGARLFLSDRPFESGWYVEAMLQLGYASLMKDLSAFVINPWFLGGYSWVFDSGLAINLGLGVQYNFYTATMNDQPGWMAFPLPVLEASLGYAW